VYIVILLLSSVFLAWNEKYFLTLAEIAFTLTLYERCHMKPNKSIQVYDWVTEQIGEGEPAYMFADHIKVWSETAVRSAIMRALENYKKGKVKK
jgi:hypothetical protein